MKAFGSLLKNPSFLVKDDMHGKKKMHDFSNSFGD